MVIHRRHVNLRSRSQLNEFLFMKRSGKESDSGLYQTLEDAIKEARKYGKDGSLATVSSVLSDSGKKYRVSDETGARFLRSSEIEYAIQDKIEYKGNDAKAVVKKFYDHEPCKGDLRDMMQAVAMNVGSKIAKTAKVLMRKVAGMRVWEFRLGNKVLWTGKADCEDDAMAKGWAAYFGAYESKEKSKMKQYIKERELSVPEQHQEKIALKTLKMHKVGAAIMKGMNHKEAVSFLRKIGYTDKKLQKMLKDYGHSDSDIKSFFGESKLRQRGYSTLTEMTRAEKAENAIRDMFLSGQYNGKVPVSDIDVILKSPRWAKMYGKKEVKDAWDELVSEKYVVKKGNVWVWQ